MAEIADREGVVEQDTGEDREKRTRREMGELLQELRVVLPGVQVLFAFLLAVPFAQGFSNVTPLQRNVFFGVLLCTAVATALLIAPSAHHRILWRQHLREERLRTANRLTIAGMAVLVVAMTGAIFLISDFIFGSSTAAIATVATMLLFLYLWFVHPLLEFRRENGD